MTNPLCPICAEEVFMGFHPRKASPLLIITDTPEIEDGGLSKALQLVRTEMAREHMDMYAMGYVPLYRHFVPKEKKNFKKNKDCQAAHTQWLFEDLRKYQVIFACGVDIVKLLTKQSSQNVSGLIVPSEVLSDGKILVCSVSPAQAWAMTVGEMRLAVQTLAQEVHKL